jgi:hypothetical protein
VGSQQEIQADETYSCPSGVTVLVGRTRIDLTVGFHAQTLAALLTVLGLK